MAAKLKQGDSLIAVMKQPLYSGPHKGDNQRNVGVTEGLQVAVETTVEKATGVHRMLVTFVDDKDNSRKGWVRMNDTTHKYFEFADGRAADEEAAPPAEAVAPEPKTAKEPKKAAAVEPAAVPAAKKAAPSLALKKGVPDEIVVLTSLKAFDTAKDKAKVLLLLP